MQDADRGGKPAGSSLPDAAATWPALCGIAVMAKASEAGRTKTRLVPPLNYEEAAALNTAFLRDIAQNIRTAAREISIAGYLALGYGSPTLATRIIITTKAIATIVSVGKGAGTSTSKYAVLGALRTP